MLGFILISVIITESVMQNLATSPMGTGLLQGRSKDTCARAATRRHARTLARFARPTFAS